MGQVIAFDAGRGSPESLKPLVDLVATDMEAINRIIELYLRSAGEREGLAARARQARADLQSGFASLLKPIAASRGDN